MLHTRSFPDKPGPQAENSIAPTFVEQLARAQGGARPFAPRVVDRLLATLRHHRLEALQALGLIRCYSPSLLRQHCSALAARQADKEEPPY
jgi:hypothetical protein